MLAGRRINDLQPWFGAPSAITLAHEQPVFALVRSCASPNCMRTEKSPIPYRDGCLVQVISSLSNAKNLSRGPRAVYLYIEGWRNPDVFTALRWFGLGSSFVPAVQPSQSRMRKDVTGSYGASSSVWCSLPESEMCAVLVVVANILREPAS
jgi:hypothetical protein